MRIGRLSEQFRPVTSGELKFLKNIQSINSITEGVSSQVFTRIALCRGCAGKFAEFPGRRKPGFRPLHPPSSGALRCARHRPGWWTGGRFLNGSTVPVRRPASPWITKPLGSVPEHSMK